MENVTVIRILSLSGSAHDRRVRRREFMRETLADHPKATLRRRSAGQYEVRVPNDKPKAARKRKRK